VPNAVPETEFDVAAVRARYTALSGDFIFLDAPGGTQVPDEVGEAVLTAYRTASGNIGLPYPSSRAIGEIVARAREASARFLGCSAEEIIFGGSMTALNFTLTRTLGRTLAAGDEILVTRLDHDANVAPWLELARDRDLVVKLVDVTADSALDLDDLRAKLGPRTKVVAFAWASNALGTIADARAVCDLAHEAGALAWVDAVQYAPHEPVDVRAIGADILLCSPYKFFGPHVGLGYGRRELLESWRPYKVRPSGLDPVGHRFEAGALPYELLAGLSATFGYLDSLGGIAGTVAWERRLGERLLAGLPPGARLHGLPGLDGRVPTFLVSFPGFSQERLCEQLGERGIGIWHGDNYYSVGLHEKLAWGEALRIGVAHYNTFDEIDRCCEVLADLTSASTSQRA
jgi:cysteine desulfurase family protein (TIGR01976 family)